MRSWKQVLAIALSGFCLLDSPAALSAEPAFPAKPVTIIVTFPPGGGTDLLARLIASELQKTWSQTVIVENKAGASGNIAARYVADSAADGYTLMMVNSSFAINPGVFRNLPFDPKADFRAVANVANVPSVLVVPPDSPYKSFAELLAALKSGQSIAFGACGSGSPQHLAGETINVDAKVSLQHIPYKGCGPALTDLLGKQIPTAIINAAAVTPYIKTNKVRALAVTSAKRSMFLPDVPTISEMGFPGYEYDLWNGLIAPGKTPTSIVDKINADVTAIVRRPEFRQKLTQLVYAPADSSAAEFQKVITADIDRFGALTAKLKLTAD